MANTLRPSLRGARSKAAGVALVLFALSVTPTAAHAESGDPTLSRVDQCLDVNADECSTTYILQLNDGTYFNLAQDLTTTGTVTNTDTGVAYQLDVLAGLYALPVGDQIDLTVPRTLPSGNYNFTYQVYQPGYWSCSLHSQNVCSFIPSTSSSGSLTFAHTRPPLPKARVVGISVRRSNKFMFFSALTTGLSVKITQGKLRPISVKTTGIDTYRVNLRRPALRGQSIKVIASKTGYTTSQYVVRVH